MRLLLAMQMALLPSVSEGTTSVSRLLIAWNDTLMLLNAMMAIRLLWPNIFIMLNPKRNTSISSPFLMDYTLTTMLS